MKRVFWIVMCTMIVMNCSYSFADITSRGEVLTESILEISNKTVIEQTDKRAIVSFDVKNTTEFYYPELYYMVTLNKLKNVVDNNYVGKEFKTYKPVAFEIGPNQTKKIVYNCEFPENLPVGEYCLKINFFENATRISLIAENILLRSIGEYDTFFEDTGKTFIVVDGEINQHLSGPNIDKENDVKARFSVKSIIDKEVLVMPKMRIYERNEVYNINPIIEKYGSSLYIKPGETKEINIDLPIVSRPESYLVIICLVDENGVQVSEQYSFRYVLKGDSANIKGFEVELDEKNNLVVELVSMGPADGRTLENCAIEFEAKLKDGTIVCSKSENANLGNVTSKTSVILENNKFYNTDSVIVSAKILYEGKVLAREERTVNISKITSEDEKIFSDIVGTKYEEAVTLLNGLGVLNGYPDGTFRPENTITRAELTAIMTKLNKYKINSNENSKFFDVVEEHWAKPYINVCADNGLVSGYTDGSFMPENNVKYSEAITILINSLGYKNEVVLSAKGWPDNYLSKSSEIRLHKEIGNVDFSLPATRGDIAILTMNAYLMK